MAKKRKLQAGRPGAAPPAPPERARSARAPRGAGVRLGRALAALALTFVVGAGLGIAASSFMPAVRVFAVDRARAAIARDGADALVAARAIADTPELAPLAALANALLALEHGGGLVARQSAEASLKGLASSARTQPEALYARALLHARAEEDAALDAELAKKEQDGAPFTLLARATRLQQQGRAPEAEPLLQRAALAARAPARAQLVYARALAARGAIADARAVLERLWRTQPNHAGTRALAVAIAVWDDAREETPEEQAAKQKKVRGQKRNPAAADGADGTAVGVWRTSAEEIALARLDSFGPRDAASIALLLSVIASARNDADLVAQLRPRVLAVASQAPSFAAAAIDACLLEGDVLGAEELWTAAAGEDTPTEPALLAARSRLRALKLLPEAELARRAQSAHVIDPDALRFPFGTAVLAPASPGVPLRFAFGVEVPDLMIAAAVAAGPAADTERRLKAVDALFAGERALARNDLATATTSLTTAREIAPSDPDVLLLDARLRVRQGDPAAAKATLETALAQSAEDPRVLVAVARLAVDAEQSALARRALTKLKGLGFTAPGAVALEAFLAARADDERARDALTRAQKLAPAHADTLRATILMARRANDAPALRAAADQLAPVDDGRVGDATVRAWLAEAHARRGDALRADGIVEDLLERKLAVADATFVKGTLLRATDPAAATAQFTKAAQLAPGTFLAAEAGADATDGSRTPTNPPTNPPPSPPTTPPTPPPTKTPAKTPTNTPGPGPNKPLPRKAP